MLENPKPFDQAFKSLPEASPRGFLEVMGVVEPGENVEVELLGQEISLAPVAMDAGFIVRGGAEPYVAIFEAFGRWQEDTLDKVLEYAKGLDRKYDMAIRAYMVPLVERGEPTQPPGSARRAKGDYQVELKLRWIRPWQIDAGKLLAQGKPEFAAWTPLFRSTAGQQEEAVRRLRTVPSELARYRILGGLRYRGGEAAFWQAFVERMNQMLTKEDLRESLAVQEWLEEGRQEGLQTGRQEGRREARQELGERLLRRAAARFPGIALPLVMPASIDLADLAEELIAAPDEASARSVLAAHGLA